MLRAFPAISRFRLLSRIICVSILLFLSGISTSAQIKAEVPKPINAVQGIVAAFKQHPVVIIGEAHWLRQPGEFYISLIRDREFQEAVQDIVVEFASRNNQPLLDKYIGGENVPIQEVRHIWRDTTKVASWESPITRNGWPRFAKSTKGCPRRISCACSQATQLSTGPRYTLMPIGRHWATTTSLYRRS